MARGLWTEEIRNQIIAHNGSVQNIPEIPLDLKALYRTCWEMKMRSLIDMVRFAFLPCVMRSVRSEHRYCCAGDCRPPTAARSSISHNLSTCS